MSFAFKDPIDTSDPEADLRHLSFQLAVAKELEACPKLLEYLAMQAESETYSLLNLGGIASRESLNIHIHVAHTTGLVDAYKHLHQLGTQAALIEQDYVTKTRGE